MRFSFHSIQNLPSDQILDGVCKLFKENLPSFDEEHEAANLATVAEHADAETYKKNLEGILLIIAKDTHDKVAGVLEFEPMQNQTTVNFLRWILVNKNERGNRYASVLHGFYETYVANLAQRYRLPMQQVLSVHSLNPARAVYEKWGYETPPPPLNPEGERFVLMMKANSTELQDAASSFEHKNE